MANSEVTQEWVGSSNKQGSKRGPEPTEPTVVGRVNEILNHLQTASYHISNLRSGLFGEGQSKDVGEDVPTNLESMLSLACHQAASLCGELSTISNKLGMDLPNTLKGR